MDVQSITPLQALKDSTASFLPQHTPRRSIRRRSASLLGFAAVRLDPLRPRVRLPEPELVLPGGLVALELAVPLQPLACPAHMLAAVRFVPAAAELAVLLPWLGLLSFLPLVLLLSLSFKHLQVRSSLSWPLPPTRMGCGLG
jgi:hypothetical protein